MRDYEVVLSAAAERDLDDLAIYIEEKAGATVADRYLSRLEAKIATLAFAPFRGTLRRELGVGYRTFGFERRATIMFVVERAARTVRVLRVFYGGREVRVE